MDSRIMSGLYCFGRFTLDPVERKLCADGVPVPLGHTDFRVLLALAESAGAIVTKDELMSLVGGRTARDNVLHVHINGLRKILGSNSIVNQQGRGYRLGLPVRRAEADAPQPAFRTGDARAARLIGRSEQLHLISELLQHARLVTLTGPGGVGKTRLALQAAHEASSHFPDGVRLVELASLGSEDVVPGAIASALGIKAGVHATQLEKLAHHLARKSLLVVLDNCEHVIAAAARISESLLAAAPHLKILATSREPLSCRGEQALVVPPLAVPREGAMPADDLRNIAAIELFIERATDADANFRMKDDELSIAARICRRLDGLPLAIEMAAGWAGALGLETLDAKLNGSLENWLHGTRTAPQRHSTLRATLDWSYGLLSAGEQKVLCRFAAFAGTFTLEAAEKLSAGDGIANAFEHIAGLIRKSMIGLAQGARTRRYRIPEFTRAFLLEKLAASPDATATRQRHAAYVLGTLEQATREWETTSDTVWLERYGPVLDDVRAALDWAMGEDSDDAVALAGASWPLWRELPLATEGRRRLKDAAARLRAGTPVALEALLRRGLGTMLLNAAATKEAHAEIARAAVLYRGLADCRALGGALTALAYALFVLDRIDEAKKTVHEALALVEPTGQLRTLALAYSIEMCIETTRGNSDAARVAGEKAARASEMAGGDRTAFILAANLVQLSLERGDVDGAIAAGVDITARLRNTPHSDLRGFALGFLAAAYAAKGDADAALSVAREAAPLLRDDGTLFWLFDHLALCAALAGRARDAALIASYADAFHRKSGRPHEPTGERARERVSLLLHEALADDEIGRLRELGAQLSEDQAMTIALGG